MHQRLDRLINAEDTEQIMLALKEIQKGKLLINKKEFINIAKKKIQKFGKNIWNRNVALLYGEILEQQNILKNIPTMKVQLDVPIKYTLLKHEEENKKWLGAVSVPIQKIHSKDRFSNIRELTKVAKEWKHEEEEKRRKKAGKIEKTIRT